MKISGLTNLPILILVILIMSIPPTPGNSKEPNSSKKEEISGIFFVSQTGQIGCSYYSDYWKKDRGKIRFFSIEGGKEINLILFDPRETANLIASSHDGKLIGVASFVWGEQILGGHQNIGIGCYSLSESKWLWRTNWPDWEETGKDFIKDVIFTQDDKKIIAVGNRSVFIYDARTGHVLKRWRDPFKDYLNWRFKATKVALSANGRYLVIWQEYHPWHLNDFLFWFLVNREVTVWDVEQYRLVARWKRPKTLYWGGYLSDEVIFGSWDGYIRIWSISEQKILRKWKAHWGREGYDRYAYSSRLMALTVSQDGKYIATKGFGVDRHGEHDFVKNVIKIWNLETGKFIHEFTDIEYGSIGKYRMVFSPDSRYFAFDHNGKLCLYDTQTWKEKWCVGSSTEHKD
jgi:WD40 repeat protein